MQCGQTVLPLTEKVTRTALREGWYLMLPLGVLIYLLFSGYTPLFAGTVGLALTGLLILLCAITLIVPIIGGFVVGLILDRFTPDGRVRAVADVIGIDIEAVAREIFRRYDKRAIERFSTLIDQELNYAVNHEQKRK